MGKKPLFSRRVYGTFRKSADLLENSELSVFGPAIPSVGAGGADLRAAGGVNIAYDVGRSPPRGDRLASALGTRGADCCSGRGSTDHGCAAAIVGDFGIRAGENLGCSQLQAP